MKSEILLVGYGSIGKRHARNLMDLGITPYILTKHPDNLNARFIKDIGALEGRDIEHCIISSPTARHLDDLRRCLVFLSGKRKVLIEKPLECSYSRGQQINDLARKYRLKIFIAYNLRFIEPFKVIDKFVKEKKQKIRIVEVIAGQDLREWRPSRKLTYSYSSYREQGGGVDLDLSHEIDYILWLFEDRFKKKILYRAKVSNLKINSPDIFKLVLEYKKFIVDVTLDYIRSPKERYLKIICEKGENLHFDFFAGKLKIGGKTVFDKSNIEQSYKKMLKAFLGIDRTRKRPGLCSIEEGLNVLSVLEV